MVDIGVLKALHNRLRKEYPEWRNGQAAFNALNRLDRDVADQIRGTDVDPFNDNTRVKAFYRKVVDINNQGMQKI